MSVKVKNRSYSEIYTNGTTDWLLSNVGEWQKLLLDLEVAIDFQASQQSPIEIDYINNAFILSSGENWSDYGFDNGMITTLKYRKSTDANGDGTFETNVVVESDFTITNVYGSTMVVDETIVNDGFDLMPTNFGTKRISEVIFFVNKESEGCKIKYAHIGNDQLQSGSLNSLIDGTTTEFQLPGLNTLNPNVFGSMIPVGMQSGMSVRGVKIKKLTSDENYLTQFSIPIHISNLEILNTPFTDVEYNSIRPIRMNEQIPVPEFQSVNNIAFIPQNSSAVPTAGVSNQCFLYNATTDRTQQIAINVNFALTSKTGSFPRPSGMRVSIIRYAGGSSLTFAEKTILQQFDNVPLLINQNLNVSGIFDLNISIGDSYLLAIEMFHNINDDDVVRSVSYVMKGGSIQLSKYNETIPDFYKKLYQVELEFMLSTFFDSITNFQNNESPSFLTGIDAVTDNFLIEFFPEWNNPNVKIKNNMDETERLGNTGWFNENYNQLPNDFNIDSVEYFDLNGNQVDAIDYSRPTKVKTTVSGVQNLNAQSECGFGFAWIPTDDVDFKNLQTPFYRNTFVQSGSLTDGFILNTLFPGPYPGAGIGGASMDASNVMFSVVSGKIVCELTLTPSPQFINLFDSKNENDRNYILWMSVADGTLVRNFSNRVSLLADFKSLTKNIPPAGIYPYIQNEFLEHPQGEMEQGVGIYDGFVQDDILCRMPFKIANDGSTVFQKITFGVEAKNNSNNDDFVLEKYDVDLVSFPTDSQGVQQFNFNQSRGFKLEVGNNKNLVSVKREPLLDTPGFYGYMAYFGTKIRYEDWILNNTTPNAFFDANELNNGFNNDWIHYLRTIGWDVNFFIKINAVVNGTLVQYKNEFQMEFNDYDENQLVSTTHKYFRDSDNTLLNVGTDSEYNRPLGVILSNEPTRIEIAYDIIGAGTWDVSKTYAVITIEIDRGAGRMEMRQLSSVWGSETDNPLKPVSGEMKLKLVVDGTGKILTTSCLVDPDLLEDGLKYRITGRVGCYESGDDIHLGLYENRYENLYE